MATAGEVATIQYHSPHPRRHPCPFSGPWRQLAQGAPCWRAEATDRPYAIVATAWWRRSVRARAAWQQMADHLDTPASRPQLPRRAAPKPKAPHAAMRWSLAPLGPECRQAASPPACCSPDEGHRNRCPEGDSERPTPLPNEQSQKPLSRRPPITKLPSPGECPRNHGRQLRQLPQPLLHKVDVALLLGLHLGLGHETDRRLDHRDAGARGVHDRYQLRVVRLAGVLGPQPNVPGPKGERAEEPVEIGQCAEVRGGARDGVQVAVPKVLRVPLLDGVPLLKLGLLPSWHHHPGHRGGLDRRSPPPHHVHLLGLLEAQPRVRGHPGQGGRDSGCLLKGSSLARGARLRMHPDASPSAKALSN
mmetsp:Transcript_24905/g.74990  ORF Transcript_24905/g.74990 Transcript_24905/m.74990 type:complete len:361 (-) Transcript_24905:287-1369(-)